MTTVGFLHTAQVHVPVFNRIGSSIDPAARLVHEVQPGLLQKAIDRGITDEVIQGVDASLGELVKQGCTAITCTCSTLRDLVEDRVIGGVKVQRIDRAAADQLMHFDRVLVLAALESAAESAEKLLEGSAREAESSGQWVVALVHGAWPLFETGKHELFAQVIADFANRFTGEYDAIFLSQASMLGAVNLCHHDNVVTSPGPGVKRLLEK
ncbi:MAG: hypothetical protein O3C68_02065 [Proteobacteria bacterium]|nr:hypothetical protein [Pseudomonadota bacterium]